MTLHEYLQQHGLTQVEFARRLNIRVSTLNGWRMGRRFPRAHDLAAIERETQGAVTARDFFPAPAREDAA